jgi:hypothetical protein
MTVTRTATNLRNALIKLTNFWGQSELWCFDVTRALRPGQRCNAFITNDCSSRFSLTSTAGTAVSRLSVLKNRSV